MKKYLPHLAVLVVLFTAGYLALAQDQEPGPAGAHVPASGGDTLNRQIEGEAGVSDTGVVVNFSKLASREALSPSVYKEPRVIREPGRAPRNKTIPVAGGAVEASEGPAREAAAASTGIEPQVASPALASSFKALEDSNTSIPPDTHGAVGPNHLMVTLNTQLRILTRTGATVSTATLDSFFSAVPGPWEFGTPGTFDPQIFYDPFNNRWMFTVVADGDAATSAILLAVSQTSDPTGNWKIYKVDVDSTGAAWADYPRMGFNKNWIVITVNMFGVGGTGYKRSQIYAFNKATLYAFAATAGFKVFQDVCSPSANLCAFTQTPALTYDNTLNTLYMVEDWDGQTQLRVSSITGTPAAPVYSTSRPVTPPVSAANSWSDRAPGSADFAPQLGSTNKIQTNDSRIQSVVYRNGSLWAAHTVFLPAGAPTRSSIQWWQLNPATNPVGVQQRGRVDDPTGAKFYAFPSIAVNKNNDALLGFSRFSSQQYASANYAFRAAGDAPNTLRDVGLLKAGSAPYFKTFGGPRNRWGDYSSTVVDPLNDLDMWTVQEHAAPVSGGFSRWGTWWGRVASITPTPLIQLGAVTPTDGNAGDPDVIIEPGESGNKLTIQLKNTGTGAASAISAKLATTTAGVTITTSESTYPNLAAKTGAGNNSTPFTFNVASTVPCGQAISFTLTVTYTGGGSPATLSFTVPTGKPGSPVTRNRTGTAVAIPDNNTTGVNVTLAVSGLPPKISDLDFRFNGSACASATGTGLSHTWVGDLVITLRSPQGTVVTLMSRPGGANNSGQNFCQTILDDESAGASIQNATPAQAPYTGSFKPASPLSAFDGQNPNGTWTLNVKDVADIDTGHVRAFSLIITGYTCSTTASVSPLEIESGDALASLLMPTELFAGLQTKVASAASAPMELCGGPGEAHVEEARWLFLPARYESLARFLTD